MVNGAVAQLGERVVRNDEVTGSIPVSSTTESQSSTSSPGSNREPVRSAKGRQNCRTVSSTISPSKKFPESLPPGWRTRLSPELNKPYFKALQTFLAAEHRRGAVVFPSREMILRSLQLVDYDDVRVVILGQDPYHGDGQAVGLSFAVPDSLRLKPPSLQNIFKEIESNFGKPIDQNKSSLLGWARQGVLLLNTVLTVVRGQAFSHRERGWEEFTDQVIRHLNQRSEPIIFFLWGSSARKKKELITNKSHYILEAPHPSPLSAHRGFLGCKHFSAANKILSEKLHLPPIDWSASSE